MPSKKSKPAPFTSLRIVGKKAQRLLEKAKKQESKDKDDGKKISKTEDPEELLVHLSIRSVAQATFTILLIALGVLAVYHLRDKLILLFLAVFIAAVIDPGVQALQRAGVPRGIGVLLHYIVALLLIFFLLFSFIPIIAEQMQQLAVFISNEVNVFLADPKIVVPFVSPETNLRLTLLMQNILEGLSINEFGDAIGQAGQTLSTAATGSVSFIAGLAGSVLNFIINLIIILVLAFFIQLEKEGILRWALSFLPENYRTYMNSKSEAMHLKLGQWARGQLMLMLAIFALTFIALLILRMPYALTLAVLAGFCEFIPAVGPFIAAVPAVLIALSQQGFVWALVIAGVYYVIQWCENNLLVPLIMRRAVGLSPIAILFAMMVGISFPQTIHPIVGVMLAIPITTILVLFLEDWRKMHDR